jgi:hypothetical protein
MGRKVISFSLWGNDPKYTGGAIENAKLVSEIYPGWEAHFYLGMDVGEETERALCDLGAKTERVNEPIDWTSTFWRFNIVYDDDVDVFISRDADSRLNNREATAVQAWMVSDKTLHIMRDHPAHLTEILAGMWGAKKELFPIIREALRTIPRQHGTKQADQIFLRELYKSVYREAMVHDPFFEKKPFPTKRVGSEFVGQVFEDGQPCQLFIDDLLKDPRSKNT